MKPYKVTDEELEVLRSIHGERTRRVSVKLGDVSPEFAIKPPSRAEYRRFRQAAQNEKKREGATETLTLDCIVYPVRAEFEALLDDYPALGEVLGGAVLELAGFGDIEAK